MSEQIFSSLSLLYQDEHLVAVDKPSGLLVHPSEQAPDRVTCMNLLRDQLGHWVYPVHRLDRGTSGLVLFGLHPQAASELQRAFRERQVSKLYWALCRGHLEPLSGRVDRALDGQPALTDYRQLAASEIPASIRPFSSARYCLVELRPRTGHTHQLRRHLRGLSHPIIGDVKYGDSAHNRYFRQAYGWHRLALAARALTFPHPETGQPLTVEAPLGADLEQLLIGLCLAGNGGGEEPTFR